jgi:hypothetical protein
MPRLRGWDHAPEWIREAATREGWADDDYVCKQLGRTWKPYELQRIPPLGPLSHITAYRADPPRNWVDGVFVDRTSEQPVLDALDRLIRRIRARERAERAADSREQT